MRRLTLILSDLYLPGEAVSAGALPKAITLPGLDRLLRFAQPESLGGDWRTWLARELGCGPIASLPLAHLCALGLGRDPAGSWIATPVQLEARLDHVRLLDRGLKRLLPLQRAAWIAERDGRTGSRVLCTDGKRLAATRCVEVGEYVGHNYWRMEGGWAIVEHPGRREHTLYLYDTLTPPYLSTWLGPETITLEPRWSKQPLRPEESAGYALALTAEG